MIGIFQEREPVSTMSQDAWTEALIRDLCGIGFPVLRFANTGYLEFF
jgi:hypothetical protein